MTAAHCPECGEELELEAAPDFTGVSNFYWCVACGEYRDPAAARCAQVGAVAEKETE